MARASEAAFYLVTCYLIMTPLVCSGSWRAQPHVPSERSYFFLPCHPAVQLCGEDRATPGEIQTLGVYFTQSAAH